ncbi:hypothetical protein R1sor_011218 [Riccia sorocarpa]|uniref:Uncharacterized protein n=1 Tax=Riccia sorocarpa TaxID=122646 RepID=A0ABD3I095_9MARC
MTCKRIRIEWTVGFLRHLSFMADQAEAQDTQEQTASNDDATLNIPGRDMGRQTILPFASRPTPQQQDVNYRDMGVRTPKSELARKVMGEYTFRTHEGQSFAGWNTFTTSPGSQHTLLKITSREEVLCNQEKGR